MTERTMDADTEQPQERDIEALAGAMMDEAGLAPIDAWEAACIAVRRLRAQPSPREVALEKASAFMREALMRVNLTLYAHGKVDANTDLHGLIEAALASDGREG